VVTGGVFIGLGSNLGDREATIRSALRELEGQNDIRVVCCSALHETEPVGGPPGQPCYLNAVAELETSLSPRELLGRLLAIEQRHGRQRSVPDGARTLDLDLLLCGERVIDEPDLIVPHPRMWERSFVMQPLAEICDVDSLRLRLGARPAEPRLRAKG
jgi:2-amino-4-hydroxy-6-hydroxymethyldihydropteridine diphosphokinase